MSPRDRQTGTRPAHALSYRNNNVNIQMMAAVGGMASPRFLVAYRSLLFVREVLREVVVDNIVLVEVVVDLHGSGQIRQKQSAGSTQGEKRSLIEYSHGGCRGVVCFLRFSYAGQPHRPSRHPIRWLDNKHQLGFYYFLCVLPARETTGLIPTSCSYLGKKKKKHRQLFFAPQ